MTELQQHILKITIFVFGVCTILSFSFKVPVIYTLCGFSAWAAFGHLVTLDEETLGGWSNPEGKKSIWRRSIIEVCIKFALLAVLLSVAILVPSVRNFGV